LYPSCADSSVLTVNNDYNVSKISPGYLGGLLEARKLEKVVSIPPRIVKPIAGLPSKNEEFSGIFSGEHTPQNTSSSKAPNSVLVEVLLPIHQNSPVFHSGEPTQIIKYSNIHIALCTIIQRCKYPNVLT